MLPVPKGELRVERPTGGGGGTTPPVTDKGGGVSERWGGGTPPHQKFVDALQPGIFLPDPTPRLMHKWGGVGGLAIFEVHADPGITGTRKDP